MLGLEKRVKKGTMKVFLLLKKKKKVFTIDERALHGSPATFGKVWHRQCTWGSICGGKMILNNTESPQIITLLTSEPRCVVSCVCVLDSEVPDTLSTSSG